MPDSPGFLERLEAKRLYKAYVGKPTDVALLRLLEKLYPIIFGILHKYTGQSRQSGWPPYSEDSEAGTVFDLALQAILTQLDLACKRQVNIKDIGALTGKLTQQAFYRYLEAKSPERRRLKQRLVYLLEKEPNLHLGKDQVGLFASVDFYRDQPILEMGSTESRWRELQESPKAVAEVLMLNIALNEKGNLGIIVAELLVWLERPVRLTALVSLLMTIQDIKEPRRATWSGDPEGDSEPDDPIDHIATPQIGTAQYAEQVAYIRQLWECLSKLSIRDRQVLLLSARDSQGRNIVEWIPLIGIASWSELAAFLDFTYEVLDRLRDELPWSDRQLAEQLGTSEGTVRVWRRNARIKLESCINQYLT